MSWMVLPVTVLNAAPRLPTMPACSQCEMVLLRTTWWPIVSLFHPFVQRAFDGLDVPFRSVGRRVVPLVPVFPQGDAGTDRVADDVVLDDPALAPVRADKADLLGRGRRPGSGGVAQGEAAHGDVVHPGFSG